MNPTGTRLTSSPREARFRFTSILHRISAMLLIVLAGCSPTYVIRAAYEQGKILLGRCPIEKVIADGSTSEDERTKLRFVLEAREFGRELGLHTGKSFTSYSDIGKETLAWVVVASRKDSFDLYTWWFPIVGRVPYKGFFDLQDAKKQAQRLEQEGYESSVRGTEAFSTLGWFNDPVLSTTLRNPVFRIVNTVLHESVHSTVWIKNNVPFNETLASFVGSQATVEFFRQKVSTAQASDPTKPSLHGVLQAAELDKAFQSELAITVTELVTELSRLYSEPRLTSSQKIEQRVGIFDSVMNSFRLRHPQMTPLKSINNAEIIQFTIYMTKLELFEQLFKKVGGSWGEFFKAIKGIKEKVEHDSSKDPFKELESLV